MNYYIDQFKDEDGCYRASVVWVSDWEDPKEYILYSVLDLAITSDELACLKLFMLTLLSVPKILGIEEQDFEWLAETVFNGNQAAAYITLERLTDQNLIEYGSTIRCPWLTSVGQGVLEDMKLLWPEIYKELQP